MAQPSGTLSAKVKSIISGDTLVLSHPSDPRKERQLSLAFVTAPRLKKDGDEPFAFASRDFLRKLLVGKTVNFRVLYVIPSSKREYGVAWLPDGKGSMLEFPEEAVKEGWLKVRDDAGRREGDGDTALLVEKLQVAEAHAKADSKGVWAESAGEGRVQCVYELADPASFVKENQGKAIDGIVERVLSGDRMIVRLQLSPKEHVQTMLLIAGIRAPSTKRMNPSNQQEQAAEPFGDEAQQFVEVRLLQRNVIVNVLGLSPQNQIVASVKHPSQGTIAPHILKAGLANCTDFHSTLLGADMGELRQAEKAARAANLGKHKHASALQKAGSENDAVVSRILSADTIFIRNNKTGVERRINLSSVRQPKPSDPKQAPWQSEAKEFLRKRAIGKHIKYQIDGKRAATDGYDEREMATVTLAGKNIGLLLVENGFASVIRHRADDIDRSPIYDDLLLAEQEAQTSKKGIWSDKANAAKQYVDHSESLEKARRQMTLLSRQRKVSAIVDFVKSGSRFTVLIPKDNAKLTFVLSGIRAPRSARNPTDQGEPFGKEAHEFANRRLQQRDVEIDVEDVDKVGGFIGALYVNRENFAKLLLEEGFASVHAYSAEKSGNGPELFAAERKAKEGRKGMWHDWDPSQDEDGDDFGYTNGGSNGHGTEAPAEPRKQDYRDVVVTHVDDSGRLKLQQIGTGTTAKLEDLMSSFRKFHLTAKPLADAPKVGEVVSAKFMGDWYRAKIRRNDREKKRAEVNYFDYGNSEMVDWTDLRPLPQEKFGPQVLRPQAVDATLSYVQLPSGQYLADTIDFLQTQVQDRQLVASVDFQEKDGSLSVTLYDAGKSEKAGDSINAELVLEGLAMVPRKMKAWERGADILKVLSKLETEAKDAHRGTWEYGDVLPDEDLEPLRK
ncbi:hypothetical protein FKW77_000711 [Venturia effusa]|uniref:Probable endonuclease LCL3 n=1 Tax=Venturia effusa TaxID=50376 RepID=A0A517L0P5_9PEZI|nr:hypothetical protein FKW77_000711 [Venturia effusa]